MKGKTPYKGKCIIYLPGSTGLYVSGTAKLTNNIHEARVFKNPSAAYHRLETWWKGVYTKDGIILPVKLVQIGKPLTRGEDKRWY